MGFGPPLKVVPKGSLWWENYDNIFRKGNAETSEQKPQGPKKFRKRPIVITAEQFVDTSCLPDGVYQTDDDTGNMIYCVDTLEGRFQTIVTDWIVTGVKQEKYPVKSDIFALTYEPVED